MIASLPKYVHIVYSDHVRKQIALRKISQHHIERALNQPQKAYQGMGYQIAEGQPSGGGTLKVIYREASMGPQVASAHVITAVKIAGKDGEYEDQS
jgi:hypothetical protein